MIGTASVILAIVALQERGLANDSVLMMAHWQCQIWSGMTGDKDAALVHYDRGLQSGKRFVEAARSGQITSEEFKSAVPMYIAMSMHGPSDDFVLGRLYEMTTSMAHDKIVTYGPDGARLTPQQYVTDPAVQSVMAQNLLRTSNCSALGE